LLYIYHLVEGLNYQVMSEASRCQLL